MSFIIQYLFSSCISNKINSDVDNFFEDTNNSNMENKYFATETQDDIEKRVAKRRVARNKRLKKTEKIRKLIKNITPSSSENNNTNTRAKKNKKKFIFF